jgi:ketosteroid isomerase-like protein
MGNDHTFIGSETREVVQAFLDQVVAHGELYDAAKTFAAEDVTWSFPKSLRDAPIRNKRDVEEWFGTREAELFHEAPKITVEALVVDGKSAAAQIHAIGQATSGKTYDCRYVFMMTIEDGKIAEMTEFFDTKHVVDTFHS